MGNLMTELLIKFSKSHVKIIAPWKSQILQLIFLLSPLQFLIQSFQTGCVLFVELPN